jgi:hypothetical protein
VNSLVRKWGERLVRSRQYASAVALIAAFLSACGMPLVGWLSTLIIALVTLQNDPKVGLSVMAWAILPAVAILYLGQYGIFINVVIFHYLIVWLFAVSLRKYGSWANLLQAAALLGMVAVVLLYYFAPNLQNLLVGQLTTFAKEYKSSLFNFSAADIDLWVSYISLFATGLLAIGIIISNLIALFLARGWQSSINSSVSLQKEWYGVKLHFSASLVLVAFTLGYFIESTLFINLLLMALLPFVLAGLSLLHAYMATKKNSHAILFVFYVLFLFLSPYIALLLTLLGWLDSFINFRKKILLNKSVEDSQ